MKVAFTVYGQPVGKARARVTRHGTYTPAETVGYEESIVAAALEAMEGREPIPRDTPVEMEIHAWFRMAPSWSKKKKDALRLKRVTQKPDWDNIGKAVSDALSGVCYIDDAQVDARVIRRWVPDTVDPHTNVLVSWT